MYKLSTYELRGTHEGTPHSYITIHTQQWQLKWIQWIHSETSVIETYFRNNNNNNNNKSIKATLNSEKIVVVSIISHRFKS